MVYAYGLDGFARERAVPRNPNVMGYPFVLSLFVSVTNPSFFELQRTIQEHEELVWLVGNLKLEVTNLRELYDLRGVAHPRSGGDDDDDGVEESSEAAPLITYNSRHI